MKKWLLFALVLGVYLLHQDFWNWSKTEPLVFGFLPMGLAYHAAYSVLAAGMMWVMVRFAWPKELDNLEHEASRQSSDAESAKAGFASSGPTATD